MGSDLLPNGDLAPRFIVWATQDALSAPLQRLQVIKGWTVDGEPNEQVFDVACSDGLAVDPLSHRCGDNGAQVNLGDCSISGDVGAAELKTVWTDAMFDALGQNYRYRLLSEYEAKIAPLPIFVSNRLFHLKIFSTRTIPALRQSADQAVGLDEADHPWVSQA